MKSTLPAELAALPKILRADAPYYIGGLSHSSTAWLLHQLQGYLEWPLCIVTPTVEASEQLFQDLCFFTASDAPDISPPMLFPGWDAEPYGNLSPHADIAIRRIEVLFRLIQGRDVAPIIMPAPALLKQIIPRSHLNEAVIAVRTHTKVNRNLLQAHLVDCGYLNTESVDDVGYYTFRGGVLDIYCPLYAHPLRLEWVGDTLDTIREYDLATQRSERLLDVATILPVREEVLSDSRLSQLPGRIRGLPGIEGVSVSVRRQIIEDFSRRIYFPGIEYFLGLLYEGLESLCDYLPKSTVMVFVEPKEVLSNLNSSYLQLSERYRNIDHSRHLRPLPESIFHTPDTLQKRLNAFPSIHISATRWLEANPGRMIHLPIEPTTGLRQTLISNRDKIDLLKPLVERLDAWKEKDIITFIVCRSVVQIQRLRDLVEPYGIVCHQVRSVNTHYLQSTDNEGRLTVYIMEGNVSRGFRYEPGNFVLLSEEDIFGKRIHNVTNSPQKLKNAISSFSQINRGDYVVHTHHGIGIFRGIVKLKTDTIHSDFIQVEYLGRDKLYLPIHRLNQLQRYIGQQGHQPKLDKMGGVTFAKVKQKAEKGILKTAHELLKLYATRAIAEGYSFHVDRQLLESFEATFPYDETTDQLAAIESVYQDMMSEKPMDRLVCGDVGYGKTEVAIRAAYVAALNNKQVALLVPTTILALQHYQKFIERFSGFPIRVEMVNRFRSAGELKIIFEKLKAGALDILIGTHRLLSNDLVFSDLGLLIVDEEHRFGVTHKERIKRIRKNLDVLTLTATPIPRTLNMALNGLREFSLISTPPRDRQSIRTYHVEFQPNQIQEAARLELRRGGQIYFVHNRVQSIQAMGNLIKKLLPEARVAVAHGQMDEKNLERVMMAFVNREIDILCCTSIVESGLDIATANTMFINRADRFGLAQLYQLRGRVGRSAARAYCYLLTPTQGTLAANVVRRLATLVNFSDLGSGFRIASEDLEMRGAGNILGESQSGNIGAIGLDLYCELLDRALQELQGKENEASIEPEMDLRIEAYLPESYMPDLQTRMVYYKELSDANRDFFIYDKMEEIADRFGPLPEPAKNLLDVMIIRLLLIDLRVVSASYNARTQRLYLQFLEARDMQLPSMKSLIQRSPARYRVLSESRLSIVLTEAETNDLGRALKNVLQILK